MNMHASSSRGHRMVTLALNQQLRERIVASKKNLKTTRPTDCADPDYRPTREDICILSSSSGHQCDENYPKEESESAYQLANSVVEYIVNLAIENAEKNLKSMYTKKGTIRKRKMFDTIASERKKQKRSSITSDHKIKEPCDKNVCILKCSQIINEHRQIDINKQYWDLDKQSQRLFVHSCIKKVPKKSLLLVQCHVEIILLNII